MIVFGAKYFSIVNARKENYPSELVCDDGIKAPRTGWGGVNGMEVNNGNKK